jgi:hypothetical protein
LKIEREQTVVFQHNDRFGLDFSGELLIIDTQLRDRQRGCASDGDGCRRREHHEHQQRGECPAGQDPEAFHFFSLPTFLQEFLLFKKPDCLRHDVLGGVTHQ